MNKDNEIKNMVSFLEIQFPIEYDTHHHSDFNYTEVIINNQETAENFVNAGYGDINQNIKDFADAEKKKIEELLAIEYAGKTDKQYHQRKGMKEGLTMAIEIIDQLLKEYFDEDK